MAGQYDDEDDEKPLDPAVERIQARLRRMILFSGGTLGIGLLAILFAIVWRVTHLPSGKPAGAPWDTTIELPAGTTIVATDVDGDRLAVTLDGPGGRSVDVYDMPTGARVGRSLLIAR